MTSWYITRFCNSGIIDPLLFHMKTRVCCKYCVYDCEKLYCRKLQCNSIYKQLQKWITKKISVNPRLANSKFYYSKQTSISWRLLRIFLVGSIFHCTTNPLRNFLRGQKEPIRGIQESRSSSISKRVFIN